VVLAPLENLLQDLLVDLTRCHQYCDTDIWGKTRHTFGMGIGSVFAAPGRSSSKFLMRMERSAT